MKVKEFLKTIVPELQKLDPETEMICQSDSEGNGYSPLSGVDTDQEYKYRADNTWSGELCEISQDCNDCAKDCVEVAIVYPIN